MNNKRELINKTWLLAQSLENRKLSGETRLKKFPLWKRLLFFWKFSNIRKIILQRALKRSNTVMIAIGMVRSFNKQQRRERLNGQSSNRNA